MEKNELKHYGIIGMKWGVRRFQNRDGTLTAAGKKRQEARAERRETKKITKSARRLSDEELRNRINRLQMEENYANLLQRRKERSVGYNVRKALGEALGGLGKKVFDRTTNFVLDKAFNEAGKFDVDYWKTQDVDNMDMKTVEKVNKWWTMANQIKDKRGY